MSESGEKTHAPSPKRLRDAAAKGDVLRSRDLATAATVLAGAGWLVLAGPWLLATLGEAARHGLRWDRAALEDFSPAQTMLPVVLAILPPIFVLGGIVLAGLAALIVSAPLAADRLADLSATAVEASASLFER